MPRPGRQTARLLIQMTRSEAKGIPFDFSSDLKKMAIGLQKFNKFDLIMCQNMKKFRRPAQDVLGRPRIDWGFSWAARSARGSLSLDEFWPLSEGYTL